MSKLQFENIHCHTWESNTNACAGFPDSPVSIFDYAKVYNERGMKCVIASEHGFRGNVWDQADAAAKYEGMKAICASEAYFVPDRDPEKADGRNFHLLLLAKNLDGFHQLNMALSKANMTGYYRHGRLDFELLSALDYRNFLCTTACVGGILKDPDGERLACQLAEIFRENFRLEVQYHNNEMQAKHNAKVMKLYQKHHWPLIFATDSHYIYREQKILRKELQLSTTMMSLDDADWDLYLPTAEEAYQMMVKQGVLSAAQIEEAFENTLEVRDWDGFTYTTERKLPVSQPRRNMTHEQRKHLYQKMVCDGYIDKFGKPTPEQAKALRDEMNVILDTDSEDYFISLKDMLDRGVELGGRLTTTARGSAGSFATNAALNFTTINRLTAPVSMYPERFISADKLKAGNPDIDSNIANVEAFEQAGKEMFGEYGCLPMVAFGKNKVSSAFKMLARARNLDFNVSNAISKQIQNYELDKKHAIENNSDDPDYNVDDDVRLEDYIDPMYMDLVNDSKQYQGIVVGISPHPCAHLTYHKDLREEIGVVRLKAKSGNKEPKYCAYIDGARADQLNYVKSDLLRVDVVKMIADTFAAIGKPVMPVDELLSRVVGDQKVWSLYWNGHTQCLNQCERYASTQRCMQFKPQNVVELTAFVAAIRPGFKSMLDTFISRSPFTYGIPSLDELLKLPGATGSTGQSSFLLFDEQILRILIAGGIPGPEAYATIKAIKKKKKEKISAEKEKFKNGFGEKLLQEGATAEDAEDIVEKIWTIIENAASYMFCAAHAYAMACDSLYAAWLKAYYPYEFYATVLKLYTDKGNKQKVSLIISEMKDAFGIKLNVGKFGQDNRDWYIDKNEHTISQSLASVKFMSPQVAEDLFQAGKLKFDSFSSLLWYLMNCTCLKSNQIEKLIGIGYFSPFGKTAKLMSVFIGFHKGKNKMNKKLKSWEQRLELHKDFERSLPDEELPILDRLFYEQDNTGLCYSSDRNAAGMYFVTAVEDKYKIIVSAYNVARGESTPTLRVKKQTFNENGFRSGDCLRLWRESVAQKPRYSYKNGTRTRIPGTFDYWLEKYQVIRHENEQENKDAA